jgi:NNP family nitrate/nitrite transporter-like MFS transporter
MTENNATEKEPISNEQEQEQEPISNDTPVANDDGKARNMEVQSASSSGGRKIPTNQEGQATRLWLCHCQAIQIRVFHITWFTFWLCFFGWFATANLYKQIQADLGLTVQHKAIAGGLSVASTVLFRVITGAVVQKLGSRKTYAILLVVSSFPICGMALVSSPIGYIVTSLFIGIVGAAFVITQYHTTRMFAGKTVGTANATSAGWGNFGGGCANFFMPVLLGHFKDAYGMEDATAWRVCMLVPGCCYLVLAVIYYFGTVDEPPRPKGADTISDPDGVHINKLEAVTKENAKASADGEGFKVGAGDYRTWLLFAVYAACFGIELTVLRFAVGFFRSEFGMTQSLAGFIVLCFSFCNLFARSIGGLIADVVSRFAEKSLNGRVYSLFIVLFAEAIFVILFSFGGLINSLGYTIFMLIAFSLFVQAAEGVTFAIVPFIQPKAIGPVAGIVGAGGNMGAMIMAFTIFSNVPDNLDYVWAWLILGIFVLIVSFMVFFIRFTDEEIKSADEKMNTWQDLQK